jgi:hypothetical protein
MLSWIHIGLVAVCIRAVLPTDGHWLPEKRKRCWLTEAMNIFRLQPPDSSVAEEKQKSKNFETNRTKMGIVE